MSIETELKAIKGNREMLLAEEVVEWARTHPKSKLHKAPEFCGWDLKKAAYQHWIWGARRLIALNLVFGDGQRQFYSLSVDRTREGGGYRDIGDILRDKSLHEILLADALKELERLELKYNQLKALRPVWREAKKLQRGKQKGPEHRAAA